MTTTNLDPPGDATDVRRIGGIPISLVRSESTLLVVLLAVVLLIGGVLVPSVFQLSNLANMSRDASVVGLGAIGVTFVLLTGELDLSVGSIMSLSLVVGGKLVDQGPVVALLVTAVCGILLGAVNGLAVGFGRVNSLIMTLGTLALYSGLASVVTRGQAIYLRDAESYTWFGRGTVLEIPVPVLIFAAVTAITTLVLTSTRIGRTIYFTGTNPVAAWHSGINVARTKLLAFMVSGLLAAMCGPLLASLTKRITPEMGSGFELGAIAVAVLGGTALAGGRGTAIGTAVGALIFGLVSNILALSGLSTYTNQVVRGCLLVVVVILVNRVVRHQGMRSAS